MQCPGDASEAPGALRGVSEVPHHEPGGALAGLQRCLRVALEVS